MSDPGQKLLDAIDRLRAQVAELLADNAKKQAFIDSLPDDVLLPEVGRQQPLPVIHNLGADQSSWQPIATAPKDREIYVWCPAAHGLPELCFRCKWHKDAGFHVGDFGLRTPTMWAEVPRISYSPEGQLKDAAGYDAQGTNLRPREQNMPPPLETGGVDNEPRESLTAEELRLKQMAKDAGTAP